MAGDGSSSGYVKTFSEPEAVLVSELQHLLHGLAALLLLPSDVTLAQPATRAWTMTSSGEW